MKYKSLAHNICHCVVRGRNRTGR